MPHLPETAIHSRVVVIQAASGQQAMAPRRRPASSATVPRSALGGWRSPGGGAPHGPGSGAPAVVAGTLRTTAHSEEVLPSSGRRGSEITCGRRPEPRRQLCTWSACLHCGIGGWHSSLVAEGARCVAGRERLKLGAGRGQRRGAEPEGLRRRRDAPSCHRRSRSARAGRRRRNGDADAATARPPQPAEAARPVLPSPALINLITQ